MAKTVSEINERIRSGMAVVYVPLMKLVSVWFPKSDFAVLSGVVIAVGNVGGCIGEVSSLLLLVGGIFLIATKIITWRIPVVYIGSFALLSWVFGGIPYGLGAFHGEVLLPLFTGGLMLGAFFMATDWVTTPTTPKGEIIFAVGCGFFTFLIRYFGSLPEGVSLAIILMNIVSPTIERFVKVRPFGYVRKKKEAKA